MPFFVGLFPAQGVPILCVGQFIDDAILAKDVFSAAIQKKPRLVF